MKYKHLYKNSARSMKTSITNNQQQKRCLLCDSLLKSHRYLFMGKSIQDPIIINKNKTITYAECCQKYLQEPYVSDKVHTLCSKCCDTLQRIHSLHLDAEKLSQNLCRTFYKTKRLNQIRRTSSKSTRQIEIKEESLPIELVSDSSILEIDSYSHNHTPSSYDTSARVTNHIQSSHIPSLNSAFVPRQPFLDERHDSYSSPLVNNLSSIPYAQFMIESPVPSNYSHNHHHHQEQQNGSNARQLSIEDERSRSPSINDEENGSKNTRLTRRQYEFLIKLPDQQSLNAFIEASSSESNSRWTWRRTSANSRGYKIYYVCNFSMRRHYHPCPAAMYALFNPEGSISIYAHGKHQHIAKNRLPLSITDESKDEIFKCLQAGMSSSDIREHLMRRQLPFGDTKKLNNFIKYHKELLRFGAVTNVRLNGTAYRQPQFWAIRRPSPTDTNTTTAVTLS